MTVSTLRNSHHSTDPARRLRQISAAVRVSFMWLGVRKTLTPEQKSQAAESFGAEGDFLSARKKLPQALRANETLRQHIATQRLRVQSVLDGMMVDRPRRNIIRNRAGEGGSA